MRWWLHIDPPCIMSVDNASVKGMDFSELIIDDPDLWMVQWIEGRGEIERQIVIDGSGDGDANLNGLRETFIDVTPYAPLFQQFLYRMQAKALLLPQAKNVQIDLIKQIFDSKRQAPFHYPVAAGDYWWDATDDTMQSSPGSSIQNLNTKVNSIIGQLNSQFPSIKAVGDANDSAIVSKINDLVLAQVNAWIVTAHNTMYNEINAYVVAVGNALVAYINNTMLGTATGAPSQEPNTINNKLQHRINPEDSAYGLSTNIALSPQVFTAMTAGSVATAIGAIAAPANVFPSWTAITNVQTGGNVQWIPIGATAPVTVTPTEQTGILNGIAARTNDLNAKRNVKIAAVNALTTVPAVIAYDVTTGW